ncbi:MAG: DUF456 domain-containing protein [Acidimicrobiales bacterium]
MNDAVLTVLVALTMAIGLLGVLLPILPGILLIWVAALVYGLVVGFGPMGWLVMTIMTVGVVVSLVTSVVIPKQAAEESGATGTSQLAGLVGGVVGFFVIPVLGLPIGALLGILGAEYLRAGDFNSAWRATKGVARGFGKSAVVDLGLGLVMVGSWAIWVLTVLI